MDAKTLEARARAEGTPVIDGDTATFVWKGRGPVSLHGDFQDWQGKPLPFKRVGPGLWARSLTLPRDAYVEYALLDARGRRVRDAFNPRLSDNGFGEFNHCFYMPEGRPPEVLQRPRGSPRGRVTRHTLETADMAVGGRRTLTLYAPPTRGPVPLVVVLDGDDYLRRVKLPEVVDSLVARGLMRPVALALLANGGEARSVEYTCSEYTVDLLLRRVLPRAREELSLVDEKREPGAHAVLGSSFGGLMALFAGLRAPETFGRVLSQSGAFAVDGRDFVVFDLARQTPRRPLDVWMDCGRFEVLLEGNQRMAPLLTASGHRVEYREYNGGHNYPAWRDDLWHGLQWLYPAPPAKRR
ncbi:esterase family protein [Pyxidicoccus fallax]|uniref:Esterase family protein n=1 Tax=Pyxidicoccus fallax TaxID=394095 RepID=A0A848L815_9BACT|nr:alpha/beta hydrolase-fold protein [Pyxidicoccus fallax]NMO14707.1 esterase family protein [Pyxidicoccus fallax]NPC83076.1 esterase family protein [Pyxidicoccus fallax]